MKMMGELGWEGQCGCCCGRDTNKQVRLKENIFWRKEYDAELQDDWEASNQALWLPPEEKS